MRSKKYPCVRQHSEEDCGTACIASIAKYYGRSSRLSRIRELVGTGPTGTTLLGLRRGAESFGFNARSVKAPDDILDRLHTPPLPAIIHWRGYHWVVWYGKQGNQYIIGDPSVGICLVTKKEMEEAWSNHVMLLLQPDSVRFLEQQEDLPSGFGRFIHRTWQYRGILANAFLCALVMGGLSLTSPLLIQTLTDDVLVRGDTSLLNRLAIVIVIMAILSSGLQLIQSNLIAHFAQRLEPMHCHIFLHK